jgi:hypothetical protein
LPLGRGARLQRRGHKGALVPRLLEKIHVMLGRVGGWAKWRIPVYNGGDSEKEGREGRRPSDVC